MEKYILTIDLGTTAVKFGLYNSRLEEICKHSTKYSLDINSEFIEFDVEEYWSICKKGIQDLLLKSKINSKKVASISLSSQAETLVILDREGKPLRKAISWLDSRSGEECNILKDNFDIDDGYKITGQPDIVTTWPITKILWIKRNEKEIFDRAYKYLLLKDYVIYKFTGKFISEYTIYNFSYYFNIVKKRYWEDILRFVGIDTSQLPELIEPGEIAGNLLKENLKDFNFSSSIYLNVGALDQMAGMIGVGNIREGIVSETTGTVLAICTMLEKPLINRYRIPCHYNAVKNTYILLPICESGGISLEWFKNNFYTGSDYSYINREIEKIAPGSNGLIFLPYLTGVNSPELDSNAKGVFYGINISHNRSHFARSIMEGIACLIRKNLDYLKKLNINTNKLISLGGGSKSNVWNQIKADVIGKGIIVTEQGEPASLGVAILAAVKLGLYKDLKNAVDNSVRIKKVYNPCNDQVYEKQYKIFLDLYKRLEVIFRTDI